MLRMCLCLMYVAISSHVCTCLCLYGMLPCVQAPSEASLCGLMSVLLSCLVDERLSLVTDGVAMLKALNLLMMKILENCNRTHVFGALLDLLRAPSTRVLKMGEHDKMEARWYDLVVKCTIKITKMLPSIINVRNMQLCLSA